MEIDGFDDLVEVGEGGFATVYRAHQARFDRPVALKVLKANDLDSGARRRFERECQVMGRLSWHPHVVAVFDSGITAEGHPYLVMEYLDRGSVADRLRTRGPLPWADAVDIGVQVAGALEAVHEAGRTHRDLKPENLLIGPFGEIKLADFGIASLTDASHSSKASFTAHYVAPEILRGHKPGPHSDIYSLASTIYTLVMARPAFVGNPDEPIATILIRALETPAPRLDNGPDDLADLITTAMAKDPDQRPPTAAQLGRSLQGVQTAHGLPVTALRTTPEADTALRDTRSPPPPQRPRAATPASDPQRPLEHAGDPNATVNHPPQDVETAPPGTSDASAPARQQAPRISHSPRSRVRRTALVVAGALLIVPLTIAAFLATRSNESQLATDTIDEPESPQVTHTIDVGDEPERVAVGGGAVWVTNSGDDTVTRIDPVSSEATDTIDVGVDPFGVAVGEGAVWVTNSGDDTVTRIDPVTSEATDTIDVGETPFAVAVGEGAIWVANSDVNPVTRDPNTLTRVDPITESTTTIDIPVGGPPGVLAVGEGALWVINGDSVSDSDDIVTRIDPTSNEPTASIGVGGQPFEVAIGQGAIWVSNGTDNTVTRIDPTTNEATATIDVGDRPFGVAVGEGAVWVANSGDNTVTRIDPTTNRATDTIDVGDRPFAVAVGEGAIWVNNFDDNTVSRIDPAST